MAWNVYAGQTANYGQAALVSYQHFLQTSANQWPPASAVQSASVAPLCPVPPEGQNFATGGIGMVPCDPERQELPQLAFTYEPQACPFWPQHDSVVGCPRFPFFGDNAAWTPECMRLQQSFEQQQTQAIGYCAAHWPRNESVMGPPHFPVFRDHGYRWTPDCMQLPPWQPSFEQQRAIAPALGFCAASHFWRRETWLPRFTNSPSRLRSECDGILESSGAHAKGRGPIQDTGHQQDVKQATGGCEKQHRPRSLCSFTQVADDLIVIIVNTPDDLPNRTHKKQSGGCLSAISIKDKHSLDPRDDPERVCGNLIQEGYYLDNPCYSKRLFLGGLPPDWTKRDIEKFFGTWGLLIVDWPVEDSALPSYFPPNGYCFVTYDDELSVRFLVNDCEKKSSGTHPTEYFIKVNSMMCKNKEVQVRPWILSNNYCIPDGVTEKEIYDSHSTTIFVGGLPRPYTAMQLKASTEAFGLVKAVLLHHDPCTQYPQGSGRVIFEDSNGYHTALDVKTLSVTVDGKSREMEMKAYIRGRQPCSNCACPESPIFCQSCLKYFCVPCFEDGFCHPQDLQNPHKIATVNESGAVKRWND